MRAVERCRVASCLSAKFRSPVERSAVERCDSEKTSERDDLERMAREAPNTAHPATFRKLYTKRRHDSAKFQPLNSQAGELLPVCQELLPLHTSLYMLLGLDSGQAHIGVAALKGSESLGGTRAS